MEEKLGFDQNLYSRQMFAFGVEAMGKLVQMRVLVHGLRGLGIETLKNLILAGPKTITIHDDNICEISDLGTNFYITEAEVQAKLTRSEACRPKLAELNHYVEVNVHKGEITQEIVKNFDVVVVTDCYNKKKLIELNNFCRSQTPAIGFILGGCLGLFGYAFVDFGDSHTVFDKTGEENRTAVVSSVSHDEHGIVAVHDEKRHGFEDGDWVVFREVQGMTELNGQKFKITYKSPFTFGIGDTTKFKPYIRDGYVEQIKVPVQLKFKSLADALDQPYPEGKTDIENPDLEKFTRPHELLNALSGMYNYYEAHHELPHLLSEATATDYYQACEHKNNENKGRMDIEGLIKLENLDKALLSNIALYSRTQHTTSTSFWGGILAQEIVKYTGKFTPLRQWMLYENYELIQKEGVTHEVCEGCRYRDQIALFGKEFQEKIQNQKFFMIGAGALGCEFLKMFALMGLAAGPKGELVVTDDDSIEMSNLNRQFLFRKQHIKQSKSEVAVSIAKQMNPAMNASAKKLRASADNEAVFHDNFWDGLDAVTNAVDNVQARLYVDSKCVFHNKFLFESGTLGTKCNSQIVIPRESQSYGDSQDPPEESIPLCTLKNYPYLIEHTIQWARDYFEGQLSEGSAELNKYLANPADYVQKLGSNPNIQIAVLRGRLELIKQLSVGYPHPSHQHCANIARQMFQDIFCDQIANLLNCFPEDSKTAEGQPFWTAPKRLPHAIEFNATNPMHIDFMEACINILAFVFKLPEVKTREEIVALSEKAKYTQSTRKVAVKANEKDTTEEKGDDDDEIVKQLGIELAKNPVKLVDAAQVVEFEKDDETNHHIDFISAVANIRAENYTITPAPKFKIKMIAGKIIPAIATTTAMVVGAVGFEIIKFSNGKRKLGDFKNSFMNLAIPLWVFSEPLASIKNVDKDYDPILLGPIKSIPPNWTNWDTICVEGPKTLQQLFDQMKTDYGVEPSIVTLGKAVIYCIYPMKPEYKEKLAMKIEDIYAQTLKTPLPSHRRYIALTVSGSCLDGTDANIPVVKYKVN